MSAAEFTRTVPLGHAGRLLTEASEIGEVWLSWSQTGARMSGFIPTAKGRELAAALIEACDATDEAESGVKL